MKLRGKQLWETLDNARAGFISRCEQYAALTIPKVCLPGGVNHNSRTIQNDFQSVGAQAVNNLTNKLMMGLFQPSFPFFRLDISRAALAQLQAAMPQLTEDVLREGMTATEKAAIQLLDQKAIRPDLYECMRALIIVGNSCLDMREDSLQVRELKSYVVRRSLSGKLIAIVFRDELLYEELEDEVRDAVPQRDGETKAEYIEEFLLEDGMWTLTRFVDGKELGEQYGQQWPEGELPIAVLCWDRARSQTYGSGLVEDYSADFGTLSTLTEAEIVLAIQLSDYRWQSHPTGLGNIEDFKNSRTGDVIPGGPNDLSMVSSSQSGQSLMAVSASAATVIQRIGRAFLLPSSVQRQAERVTAEEIRLVATELETSFGGVYSRLAVDLQTPIVYWLLEQGDNPIQGTEIKPTIVAGLDALSRNIEAQQLNWFLADAANLQNLGEMILPRLKVSAILSTLASARGVVQSEYVLSEEEYQQLMAQRQQQQMEQEAAGAMAQAGAQQLAKG